MRFSGSRKKSAKVHDEGFALIVTVMLMTLLALLAVGLLGLSAIQLRTSSVGEEQAIARSNARLALIQAIAQLQRQLGPDQRVSGSADLAGHSVDQHWTGVWSSLQDDGTPYLQRDPETGSWIDSRSDSGWDADTASEGWLVSGDGRPGVSTQARIPMVGVGSVGQNVADQVSAPLIDVAATGGKSGGMAWWTGDLGLRANISVPDRHGLNPGVGETAEAYRRIASQRADHGLMSGGFDLDEEFRGNLITPKSVELVAGQNWSRQHFHDYTVSSRGLLTNTRDGGLKLDLTAYFNGGGQAGGAAVIRDTDPLFVDLEDTRRGIAGPTMGLLRDWAVSTVPFAGGNAQAVPPEIDDRRVRDSELFALCNEQPARLDQVATTNLQPILVEASNFTQISAYRIARPPTELYQLRHHLYPRVVLWNPYNVALKFDPAVVMIQGNGRHEMWTENEHYNSTGRLMFRSRSQWLSFEGGRSTDFVLSGRDALMQSNGYNDPYMGSYYFTVPETTFEPGECLVFSPAYAGEYDGLSPYRQGNYNLSNNLLSCEVAPDPSRSFYVSASDIGGGIRYRPVRFWYAPTPYWSLGGHGRGVENQSDDTRVIMKRLQGRGQLTFERFDELPQLAYLSASLQYGAGKEPRVSWDDQTPMTVELLDRAAPRPTLAPDVRTRDGIRMRWFEEHPSNLANAGPMSGNRAFFQEALFANWNPRAAYAVRTPWENIAGTLPTGGQAGSGGGPWFFGAYTRDLYDEAVGWGGQVPRFQNGRYLGNPFGPPQEGMERNVLFELPRNETGVISLGQMQSLKLTEFVWHPSFAIGNSLADPRLGYDGLDRTIPPSGSDAEAKVGGFHRSAIGWSSDSERGVGADSWASQGRALLQRLPEDEQIVYDLSFEANHALWDRVFLSSGDAEQKRAFLADPQGQALPNGRMSLSGVGSAGSADDDFNDPARAAYHLMVDGAFNVNSTRVEAWKAMLAATRDLGEEAGTPFARILDASDGPFDADGQATDGPAWAGFRALSDDEIERLAEAIVEQVQLRGPFLSLSDFVNRRLRTDETGRSGVLQAAIDRAGINRTFEVSLPIENEDSLRDYRHPDNIADPLRMEQTLKPDTLAWGAPGFLTQGDLLQSLGPVIKVRSDTFLIRAYGECRDASGRVVARAWCEGEVQRTPEPVEPAADPLNPDPATDRFGRRFEIVAFRWLRAEEV